MPFQLRLRRSIRQPGLIDLGAEFGCRNDKGTEKQKGTTNVLYRDHGRILDALSFIAAGHFPVRSLRLIRKWSGERVRASEHSAIDAESEPYAP